MVALPLENQQLECNTLRKLSFQTKLVARSSERPKIRRRHRLRFNQGILAQIELVVGPVIVCPLKKFQPRRLLIQRAASDMVIGRRIDGLASERPKIRQSGRAPCNERV